MSMGTNTAIVHARRRGLAGRAAALASALGLLAVVTLTLVTEPPDAVAQLVFVPSVVRNLPLSLV